MTRFGVSVIFGIFGMDASGCVDVLWQSSMHVQWFSHQNNRADDHDVII